VFQVANQDGKTIEYEHDIHPSLVGYSKPGIIPGILPTTEHALFGEMALEYRLHLELKWPLKDGFVNDVGTCREYVAFLRKQIDPKEACEIWGVIGAPACASKERQKVMRATFSGVFDKVLIVPEPFLAAMGLRDDDRAGKDPEYVDPTKHSLIVDIGAGTTDCCLVQGYFPTADDQTSVAVAGDTVDEKLSELIARRYPDIRLTRVTITKMKEANSFVGKDKTANVKVFVDGKPRTVDFGALIREACEILVEPTLKCIRELFSRCDSESVEPVLKNIIVAGGGSQITGLPELIQKTLREEGFDGATTMVPEDYRRLVARGALKIANNVRDDQWQVPL
jgi:rod shape-determining protein MreB